jgi:hypothetical protein
MKTYYYTHEDMDPRKHRCFFYKTDSYTCEELPAIIFNELGHRVVRIWEAAE